MKYFFKSLLSLLALVLSSAHVLAQYSDQIVKFENISERKTFDGVGLVNGGGATSVLLKDYPHRQRKEILDMVYKPKFGASVSALLVEIPGDGNSTQGSMPSHMHTRDDLNYSRGYTWWVLQEAKKRNPALTLDGTAWSAPIWIGNGNFWSQDAADYYIKWLEGLRNVYGLEFDAIGCRNEKGMNYEFPKLFRRTLDQNGFENVQLHAFDHWDWSKLNFVKDLFEDKDLCDAIDIIGAHVFYEGSTVPDSVQRMAERLGKKIWNTEDHVYRKGYDCLISSVECFNLNYIANGATKIVNWYDIAGVYPMEPYSEDPPLVLAYEPWSGHYKVRDVVWAYAHYGQFTEVGWKYVDEGCRRLDGGGTMVALKSESGDYSIIVETKNARHAQRVAFDISGSGLKDRDLCVWRSNAEEQFVRLQNVKVVDGKYAIELEPNSVYSLSTTRGQRKGGHDDIPDSSPFPFPYGDNFDGYEQPERYGYLPRYTADICGVFELADDPAGGEGKVLRQVVDKFTNSWAPNWRHYSIIGDRDWKDYEVCSDVWLNKGDVAAVMGRVNHVGTGYGFIPKGYYLQMADNGECKIVVVRGKINKKQLVGDAEQQAIIRNSKDEGEGGEKILAQTRIEGVTDGEWHRLKLRFEGCVISAFVDGKCVMQVEDALYENGMAGLLVGNDDANVSTPYFDNLIIAEPKGEDGVILQKKRHKPLY